MSDRKCPGSGRSNIPKYSASYTCRVDICLEFGEGCAKDPSWVRRFVMSLGNSTHVHLFHQICKERSHSRSRVLECIGGVLKNCRYCDPMMLMEL